MDDAERRRADSELRRAAAEAVDEKIRRRFRVVLEGIKSQYETPDSFAIKFGIALNQPVTKVKHYLRSVPTMIWEGENPTMAAGLLKMIDEAGGEGRIDEITPGAAPATDSPSIGKDGTGTREEKAHGSPAPEQPAEEPSAKEQPAQCPACPKCGFPAREGDRYCQFCMSPLEERRKSRKAPQDAEAPKARRAVTIPAKRLLLYVSIVLLALIAQIILSL